MKSYKKMSWGAHTKYSAHLILKALLLRGLQVFCASLRKHEKSKFLNYSIPRFGPEAGAILRCAGVAVLVST